MALPIKVAKLEDAPDYARKDYVQHKDGFFLLDGTPADGWGIDQIDSLKRNLSEVSEKHAKATEHLKGYWDAEGKLIDPKKAKEAMEQIGKMANWTPEEKVKAQIEATKAQLEAKYGEEREKFTLREKQLLKNLEEELVDARATAAISKLEGDVDLLLPHVKRAVQVKEEDGRFVPRVLDDDGKTVRLSKRQGNNNPMDVSEFVETVIKTKFPAGFKPTIKKGSGSEGGGGEGHPATGEVITISSEDARDTMKYRAARERAKKAGATLQVAN